MNTSEIQEENLIEKSWQLIFDITRLLHEECDMPKNKTFQAISFSQLRVLITIFSHHADALRLKDIANELHQTKASTSNTINILVQKGLVESCVDKKDRRAVSIRLTNMGKEIRSQHSKLFTEKMSQLLQNVPLNEQKIFFKVMKTLWENLHHKDE